MIKFAVFMILASASQVVCCQEPPDDELWGMFVTPYEFEEGNFFVVNGLVGRAIRVTVPFKNDDVLALNIKKGDQRRKVTVALSPNITCAESFGSGFRKTLRLVTTSDGCDKELFSEEVAFSDVLLNEYKTNATGKTFALKRYLAVVGDKYLFVKVFAPERYWEGVSISCGYSDDCAHCDDEYDRTLNSVDLTF